MKQKHIKALPIVFIAFCLFIYLFSHGRDDFKNNTDYLNNVNLKLVGEIENLIPLTQGHGYGIIQVSINKSSISNYDERNVIEPYLGVIKEKKAEIIVNFISILKKNDTVIIDSSNFKVKRNDKIILDKIWELPFISIMQNPYREINKKLKL